MYLLDFKNIFVTRLLRWYYINCSMFLLHVLVLCVFAQQFTFAQQKSVNSSLNSVDSSTPLTSLPPLTDNNKAISPPDLTPEFFEVCIIHSPIR